jgi:hypothetical protein
MGSSFWGIVNGAFIAFHLASALFLTAAPSMQQLVSRPRAAQAPPEDDGDDGDDESNPA